MFVKKYESTSCVNAKKVTPFLKSLKGIPGKNRIFFEFGEKDNRGLEKPC